MAFFPPSFFIQKERVMTTSLGRTILPLPAITIWKDFEEGAVYRKSVRCNFLFTEQNGHIRYLINHRKLFYVRILFQSRPVASQEVLTTAGRGFYQANAFIFGKALVHCIFLVDISGYGEYASQTARQSQYIDKVYALNFSNALMAKIICLIVRSFISLSILPPRQRYHIPL